VPGIGNKFSLTILHQPAPVQSRIGICECLFISNEKQSRGLDLAQLIVSELCWKDQLELAALSCL
jgi:hypothetical protein